MAEDEEECPPKIRILLITIGGGLLGFVLKGLQGFGLGSFVGLFVGILDTAIKDFASIRRECNKK